MARIFGIRPEWGRDGRTGRTDGTGGTDGRTGRTGRTDGTDGRDGRDGRTGRTGRTDGPDRTDGRKYSFRVLLGRRNTVLQYYWDGDIQFYSSKNIHV